ncbi:MAG: diadenylate cyclase CdaA [Eubacteriales bacterium]
MSTVLEEVRTWMQGLYFPKIQVIDVVQILILAFLLYFFMAWIQRTRAYTLMRGILIVVLFMVLAYVFQMSAILWIASKLASVALLALVVIFQPELRKALESLGNKSLLSGVVPFGASTAGEERFSDRTITEIVRAVNEMSEVRTGALIVIEQNILLTEYINTGINLDADISSQLLVNIFEHNTPLHDGAVIIRGDRIVSATCYLPLSDNAKISKRYGTRHRAGLGISEVSDSFTIIVSEETGRVSIAYMGVLTTGVTASGLREQLHVLQKKSAGREHSEHKFRIRKGRKKNEG